MQIFGLDIFLSEGKLVGNKNYCIQCSWFKPYFLYNILNAQIKMFDDKYYFLAEFKFFGSLFSTHIQWTKQCDHAGFEFDLTTLGLMFNIMICDKRHWDDENECWQVNKIIDDTLLETEQLN